MTDNTREKVAEIILLPLFLGVISFLTILMWVGEKIKKGVNNGRRL